MKKILSIAAVALFVVGMAGCKSMKSGCCGECQHDHAEKAECCGTCGGGEAAKAE